MNVRSKSPRPRVISELGRQVDPGETITVDKTLGSRLCRQTDRWEAVDEPNDQED